MRDPGRELRRIRELLRLKYRDVEQASQQIARNRGNQEFSVGLSRLADIENKGTLPSVYRLYSLCVIYGLSFQTVLAWYGVNLDEQSVDSAKLSLRETRAIYFPPPGLAAGSLPLEIDIPADSTKTLYLSPYVRGWGSLPLSILASLDLQRYHYAFIGTEDWFMYPILPPGSFVQIDQSRRRLGQENPTGEHERPIHLIEHRSGFRAGWCTVRSGLLILQPHPASHLGLETYRYPGEADVLGQVIAVAKRLDLGRRRRIRS
jgi:transcriptional regulator with XRE-family HTH domain